MFSTFFGIAWEMAVPGIFLLSVIGGVVVYLLWCYVNMRFHMHLRTPPDGWRDYLEKASDLGAPLPSFGEKTHTIRRQLLRARGTTPIKLSTNLPLKVPKGLPKDAFVDKYTDKGVSCDRRIIYGFFHPFAAAGGGGERVLWAAVKQTLENDENNVCAVYMAKSDTMIDSPELILEQVEMRFNLKMDTSRVCFVFLNYSKLVKAEYWTRFTLIGQAIGSVIMAYQAIAQLVPDVFIDTAGYPFAYPLVEWLLNIPIAAYVHYPVVQSDMLKKTFCLSPKGIYWRVFTMLYSRMALYCTLPVTNSTWTHDKLVEVWKGTAIRPDLITTVYPPCATQDFDEPDPTTPRKRNVVYLAQFRPEKRHELVLHEFAEFVKKDKEANPERAGDKPHLVFIGSIRGDSDSQSVYSLRLLARELELDDDYVTFLLDAPWSTVRQIMKYATAGVNAMWNEHFGMVVVEYMAAGLIPIAHDSAGPKLDILKNDKGFLFTSDTDPDYSKRQDVEKSKSLSQQLMHVMNDMDAEDMHQLRLKNFAAVQDQFSDERFAKQWDIRVNILAKLEKLKRNKRLLDSYYD